MFCETKHFRVRLLVLAAVMGIFIVSLAVGVPPSEAKTKKQSVVTSLPDPPTPKPQFFCGSCHILSYPEMIQQGYDLWKKSKHKDVGCVQCHYPPTEVEDSGEALAASLLLGVSHVPKLPPERFYYIKLGGKTVRTRAHIEDASCMTADCHGKKGDDFKTKKIKFTEKVTFVHEPHFEKKNQIDGQTLNCTSCHQHETDQKKFEVSQNVCTLCHFMGSKVNDGRGRCELCHELPEEPIQAPEPEDYEDEDEDENEDSEDSGEKDAEKKPITHAMIKEAKVPCASCHFELVQAQSGATYEAFFDDDGVLQTALVYGAGRIKEENCRTCHDQEKDVKKALEMKLMHEQHVTSKNARCFDCHRPITHAKAALADRSPQDNDPVVLSGCTTCHPEPHFYQRALTSGMRNPADEPAPDPMYQTRVNCLACHVEMTTLKNGQQVLKASDKTCVSCHDKEYRKTLKDWKTELAGKIKTTRKVEQKILKALAKVKLTEDQSDEVIEMLDEARQNLNIVRFGNGIHNKEYAVSLMDEAIDSFNEVKEVLEGIEE